MARRPYGTGSLTVRRGKWFGQWRSGDQLTSRVIGPVRQPGSREGLTRVQAERELQRLVQSHRSAPVRGLTVAAAGERRLEQLEALGRKPSTIQDYRIMLTRHLAPYFANKALDRVTADDVAAYMALKRRERLSAKTITNHVIFLHGVFAYAVKRGLANANPVASVDRPLRRGGTPTSATSSSARSGPCCGRCRTTRSGRSRAPST
jgi:integrase